MTATFRAASAAEKAALRLPACLIIMDGFGLEAPGAGNAISVRQKPHEVQGTSRLPGRGEGLGQHGKLPACLIIMDGFGLEAPGAGNAISLADTPNLDRLFAEASTTRLAARSM